MSQGTAPSNFLGSIQDRLERMLVCGFGERRSHSSIAGSQTLARHVFDAIPAGYHSMDVILYRSIHGLHLLLELTFFFLEPLTIGPNLVIIVARFDH